MKRFVFILLWPLFCFARDPFALEDDTPTKSIAIQARIVSVDQHYLRSLGVLFGTLNTQVQSSGQLNMDFPAVNTGIGSATMQIAKLGGGNTLDLQLTALQNEGHADIIASPQLLTNNDQSAEISSGEEIPYQEKTGEGNTSVAFKHAALLLNVTPHIEANGKIRLQIQVNQDKIASLEVNGVPAINTQQLKTLVSVRNKQTIVLGGIFEVINQDQTVSVPGLGHLPVVGSLFSEHEKELENKELLIFITPKIMP